MTQLGDFKFPVKIICYWTLKSSNEDTKDLKMEISICKWVKLRQNNENEDVLIASNEDVLIASSIVLKMRASNVERKVKKWRENAVDDIAEYVKLHKKQKIGELDFLYCGKDIGMKSHIPRIQRLGVNYLVFEETF